MLFLFFCIVLNTMHSNSNGIKNDYSFIHTREVILCSFQFETEAEGTKLRRDVSAEGNVGVGPSTKGLVSMLSGQEEMFAFRRAVSN